MLTSMAATGLLFLSAPLIASFYDNNQLVNVLRCLSFLIVINAFSAVALALCRRELDFKTPAVATILGYASGYLLAGLPMALLGFGVYALVGAFLTQAIVTSLLTCAKARHPMTPLFYHRTTGGLFKFGATVLATRFAVWANSSLDRTIIGSVLGMMPAGLYATMNNLLYSPAISVVGMLQLVLYSANAKLQGHVTSMRSGYCTILSALSLFVVPVMVAIAAVPHTLVAALLGPSWIAGAPLITPLALSMIALTSTGASTPLLWTTGRINREFLIEGPAGIVTGLVIYLACQSGSVTVVAWAACAVSFARAALICYSAMRSVELRAVELPRLISAGLFVSAAVGLAAAGADLGVTAWIGNAAVRLALVVLACGVALVAALRVVRRNVPEEIHMLVQQFSEKLPFSRPFIDVCLGKRPEYSVARESGAC